MDAKESIKRELSRHYRRKIALTHAVEIIDQYCHELEEELSYFLEFADDDLYFNQDKGIGHWEVELPLKREIRITLRIDDVGGPLNAEEIDVVVNKDGKAIFKDVLIYNPEINADGFISETINEEICNDLLNKYFRVLQQDDAAKQFMRRYDDKRMDESSS
ncbi:hypothetical protein ACE1TF_04285 [Geomicrobium sp. JSM 1781026]|uniref:hypothetical protein n=1 Tax=Geomicrobium sp. JSM 1781026 TaxID=3344580 RepID=UPI0035BFAFA9